MRSRAYAPAHVNEVNLSNLLSESRSRWNRPTADGIRFRGSYARTVAWTVEVAKKKNEKKYSNWHRHRVTTGKGRKGGGEEGGYQPKRDSKRRNSRPNLAGHSSTPPPPPAFIRDTCGGRGGNVRGIPGTAGKLCRHRGTRERCGNDGGGALTRSRRRPRRPIATSAAASVRFDCPLLSATADRDVAHSNRRRADHTYTYCETHYRPTICRERKSTLAPSRQIPPFSGSVRRTTRYVWCHLTSEVARARRVLSITWYRSQVK